MGIRGAVLRVCLMVLTGCAVPVVLETAPPAEHARPVDRSFTVIIPEVPFISWSEAAGLDYQDKSILNPSFAASLGMVLKYWGQDLSLLKRADDALPKGPGGWGVVEAGEGKSVEELKEYIDRGIPVFVSPAFTPVAHTLSPAQFFMASAQGFKFEARGLASGILGRMVSLDTFREFEERLKMPSLESVLISARVVIGYDDLRKVLILHDPSFGPAFEVTYDEFEKMVGGVWKRSYIAAYRRDQPPRRAARGLASSYPPPTPDQRAAAAFVFGYALGSVGRVAEGEALLVQALKIQGLGRGMRHLVLLELALHRAARGHRAKAIKLAEEAAKLVPEHHRPWRFLADMYRASAVAPDEKKARQAQQKMERLCADAEAVQTAAKTLGTHFFVFAGCR